MCRRKKLDVGIGVLIPVLVVLACHGAPWRMEASRCAACEADAAPVPAAGVAGTATSVVGSIPTVRTDSLATLARTDPEAFIRHCRAEYERRDVRDYTCRFIKQETIGRKLGHVEEVAVRFREHPFSVDMEWIKGAKHAARALYVANAWKDRRGRDLAWFKPAGALIKLIVPKIKQPIGGARAKKASRRTLDQFGFRSTLDLIVKYIERGRKHDELDLRYVGEAVVAGRPTWAFERRLPFTGKEEPYPDALLVFHIDQEWLVPVACFSYADRAGEHLLGSYVLTDVKFNVGLGDDDFDPKKLGF